MPAVVCPRCARSFANAGNFSQHRRRCFVSIGHHRPTRTQMPASIVVPDASALPHKWQRVKRKQQLEREVCRPLDICQTSTRHCFSEWQTVCPFRWRVEDEAALPMPDDKKVCIGRLFSDGTSGRCHVDIYTYLAMSTRHPADVSQLTYILAWSTAHINVVSLNGTSGRCHADI